MLRCVVAWARDREHIPSRVWPIDPDRYDRSFPITAKDEADFPRLASLGVLKKILSVAWLPFYR